MSLDEVRDEAAPPGPNSRGVPSREVLAWALYDWANSAFSALSITILAAYLQKVVVYGEDQNDATGAVVWAWGIGFSMLCAAILSPITGAMADAQASKRWWLGATALSGAAGSILLGIVPPHYPWVIAAIFILTTFCFELSLGFYNAFLPEISDEKSINRVSAFGFGMGYVGGGVALVVAAAVLHFHVPLGLESPSNALRAGLVIMGLWWGLFTIPTLLVLRDRNPPRKERETLGKATHDAFHEVGHTLKNLRTYRTLAWFLVGFLFYNDGVQTVLSQASTFALRDLEFEESELIGVILMIQFLALPGAILVGRLSDRFGQKRALIGCLAVWVALLITAYFIDAKWQFWVLGACVAMVMGGIQSVSRAIMGLMTPAKHTAEFFGFFNLSGKATSFMGTFLFGMIVAQTGKARLAVVSLLVQFIIGWLIISRLNFATGQREAAAGEADPTA